MINAQVLYCREWEGQAYYTKRILYLNCLVCAPGEDPTDGCQIPRQNVDYVNKISFTIKLTS